MKKIRLVALASLLASSPCFADFEPNLDSIRLVATITANGGSASITETPATPAGPLATLANKISHIRASLQQNLSSYVSDAAAAQGGSVGIVPVVHGTITASLTGLTGQYQGDNQLALSGASTSASILASTTKLGIKINCTLSVALNNIQFAATYNAYTGAIVQDPAVTYANLNPSTSVGCSSSLDWVPFLGSTIDRFAAGKINAALQTQFNALDQTIVSTIFPTYSAQLGIDTILVPGKFVINGVDWGAYIGNNFATLFTGKSLTVSMGEWTHPNPLARASEPADVTIVTPDLVVDFSDGTTSLKLSLDEIDQYNWIYYCPSTRCIRPL